MSDNGDTPQPKSFLRLDFQAPGSAEFAMTMENISPAQMLAAAAWLDWFARRAFDASAAQRAQQGIIVPKAILKTAH